MSNHSPALVLPAICLLCHWHKERGNKLCSNLMAVQSIMALSALHPLSKVKLSVSHHRPFFNDGSRSKQLKIFRLHLTSFDRGWRRCVVLLVLFFHLNEVPDGCKICFYSNNWDFCISLILATLWFLYSNKHAVTQKLKSREAHLNKVQKERKPLIPKIHHSIVISLLTEWYFFHYFWPQ